MLYVGKKIDRPKREKKMPTTKITVTAHTTQFVTHTQPGATIVVDRYAVKKKIFGKLEMVCVCEKNNDD